MDAGGSGGGGGQRDVKLGPVGSRGCVVGKPQKGPGASSFVGRISTSELIVIAVLFHFTKESHILFFLLLIKSI